MKTKTTLLSAALLAVAITPFIGFCSDADSAGKNKTPVAFNMESVEIDRSGKNKLTSYADMLEKVTPAVVSIRTAQTIKYIRQRQMSPFDILRRFHGFGFNMPDSGDDDDSGAQQQPAIREQKVQTGLGSGTIIHPDGYILTNRHVISNQNGTEAEEITVELADKRTFTAKVIGTDPQTDVAIIKIDGKALPVAKIADSSKLRVGDIVFAIGNPMGVGMTVTHGIVSALGRELGVIRRADAYENFIQTDASINPGNSGGPLIDADGRVIGMNTAIASRTGQNIGLGFALPSNLAIDVVSSLVNSGEVARGFLGLEGQDLTNELAESFKLDAPRGALVSRVVEDSPAEKAGLKPEDVILAVNGQDIASWSALRYNTMRIKPGEEATLTIWRNGETQKIKVTIGSQSDVKVAMFKGVELKEVNDVLRKQYGIPGNAQGVVITAVAPESILAGKVPVGTLILSVNGQQVFTPEDMEKLMNKDGANRLRVFSQGRTAVITLKP